MNFPLSNSLPAGEADAVRNDVRITIAIEIREPASLHRPGRIDEPLLPGRLRIRLDRLARMLDPKQALAPIVHADHLRPAIAVHIERQIRIIIKPPMDPPPPHAENASSTPALEPEPAVHQIRLCRLC